jgi:ribosomal protein S18 acetylase RimI-like enzyme
MDLEFREAQLTEARFQHLQKVAGQETQSAETRASAADFLTGRAKRWECLHNSQTVGGCAASSRTGEVISIGVNSDYEGRGIGRRLLSLAIGWLRSVAVARIWLLAPSDPATRAYGFFRALGWRPTGEPAVNGDEILEFPTQDGH